MENGTGILDRKLSNYPKKVDKWTPPPSQDWLRKEEDDDEEGKFVIVILAGSSLRFTSYKFDLNEHLLCIFNIDISYYYPNWDFFYYNAHVIFFYDFSNLPQSQDISGPQRWQIWGHWGVPRFGILGENAFTWATLGLNPLRFGQVRDHIRRKKNQIWKLCVTKYKNAKHPREPAVENISGCIV